MQRTWPVEALEFEEAVRGALAAVGGVELARRCEADPGLRDRELRPVLDGLGLLDLDPGGGELEAAAAARAVHAAGAVACSWPLVARLAAPGPLREHVDALYLGDGAVSRAEHLDVCGRALVLDVVSGEVAGLRTTGPLDRMPLDPFGVPCASRAPRPGDPAGSLDPSDAVGVHGVLTAFWVCGALGHARDLAATYAGERSQFGRRIIDFGAIQWHLSDIVVAHDSLWELASFSLARAIDGRLTAADVLALRLTVARSARSVFDHAHQVLAAIGLCEEHDLTVLNRHVQAAVRRPSGVTRTLGLLADEIVRSGFDNLYPVLPATWNATAEEVAR